MSIMPFDFTRTQDIVFWALVRRGSSTGYGIARDTGIARANVYHALEVLAKRGLASSSGGRPSRYQAAAAEATLALLADGVRQELAALALKLGIEGAGAQPASQASAETGELQGRVEVVGEALHCIATAALEVLAVVGPWVLELLPALAEAQRRGVAVRVVSLGLPAPEGAIVRDVPRAELGSYWGGLPVAVVGDRRRAVCGVFSPDGVRGLATSHPGVVPFLRHLLRRELATAAAPRVS
jgi:sugar-specific transcriptional regulator TrmB